MCDAANGGECSVKRKMRRRIRGRIIVSFDLFAGFEVHDCHVFGLHAVVIHAGGFDHHEIFLPVDTADVAPSVNHDAALHQFKVCNANLFF